MVDKTDAVTLVLEFPRNRKDSPAAVLALIFVSWRANSRRDGHAEGRTPHPHRCNHGVGRRVDHRNGVGIFTLIYVGAGSVRGDRHPNGPEKTYRGNHGVARRVDYRNGVGGIVRIGYIGAGS